MKNISQQQFATVNQSAQTNHGGNIRASEIRLVDSSNRTRLQFALGEGGSPAIFFMDSKGRVRFSLGLYSPAEGELPVIAMNDINGNAAGLLRLVGEDSPYLILKSKGQDRSIFGLKQDKPFLVNYNSDGKKLIFGDY